MDAAQAVTDKVAAPTRMASLVAVPLHGIMDPKLLGLATIHKAAAGNEDTKISTTGTRSIHSPSQIPTTLQILSTCPILSMLPTRNMRPTSSTLLILNTRQTSSMLQISSSTKLPAPNPTAPAHKPALIQAPPGHRDNAARRAAEATLTHTAIAAPNPAAVQEQDHQLQGETIQDSTIAHQTQTARKISGQSKRRTRTVIPTKTWILKPSTGMWSITYTCKKSVLQDARGSNRKTKNRLCYGAYGDRQQKSSPFLGFSQPNSSPPNSFNPSNSQNASNSSTS